MNPVSQIYPAVPAPSRWRFIQCLAVGGVLLISPPFFHSALAHKAVESTTASAPVHADWMVGKTGLRFWF